MRERYCLSSGMKHLLNAKSSIESVCCFVVLRSYLIGESDGSKWMVGVCSYIL